MIKDKRILITGGGGFIASHIIDSLIDFNDITAYDNFTRNALQYSPNKNRVKIIKGDVLDATALDNTIKDTDIVLHLAAIAGVPQVLSNPQKVLAVNLIGTQNAINSSLKHGVEKFMVFSTSEVYGPNANKVKETDPTQQGPITELRWIYATSKLMDEFSCHANYLSNGFPYISVRPFNIYGERQVGAGAIQTFIINSLKNSPLTINGKGEQIRSWCHVSDAVEFVNLALDSPKAIGNIFNMGNQDAFASTKELAELVIKTTKSKSHVTYREINYSEVWMRIPDTSKAKKILGFKAKVSLEEGIKRTAKWFQENTIT